MIWKHLRLPNPTPLQYDIAHYLQHGPKRCIVEAFRGVGKSWITAALVLFVLRNNPQVKVLVVSGSKQRADQFSTFVKRLIGEVPFLAFLRPRQGQRDSNINFDVGPAEASQSPSVKSVGITGQITGSRADLIIADDIETQSNSLTQSGRESLSNLVKEFESVLTPNGRIVYLGTPQTEMSLYNALQLEAQYELRIWPGRFPMVDKLEAYRDCLAPYLLDQISRDPSLAWRPTDPHRFTESDLLEREAAMGRSMFMLQFMLDTTLSDAERYPLKLGDLIALGVDPYKGPTSIVHATGANKIAEDLPCVGFTGDKWYRPISFDEKFAEYTGSVMFIDPSGRGGDELAFAVVKTLNGKLFLTDMGGYMGGYTEANLKALAASAAFQKVNKVLIESNFGDGMFTALFQPVLLKVWPVSIEEVRSNTQKEKRIIDTLEPVMNQHRLVVDEAVIHKDMKTLNPQYQLFYQMTRITRDRGCLGHDDRLDALAGAVAYWVEAMKADEVKAHSTWLDEQVQKERKGLLEFLGRFSPEPEGWIRR